MHACILAEDSSLAAETKCVYIHAYIHRHTFAARPETYSKQIYTEKSPKAFTPGGVQEMYYTRAQFEARQHENMHKVRVWLNKLWKYTDEDTKEYLFVPEAELTYIDRWRHRLPGYEKQTGMKEHLDNGALSRWADPAWQVFPCLYVCVYV